MSKLEIHKLAEEHDEFEGEATELPEEVGEGEAEEEFDIVLDGEDEPEPEPEPEINSKAILHKLGQQRKRARKAEEESSAKDSEIEDLKAQVAQLTNMVKPEQPEPVQSGFEYGSPAPVPPDRYSAEINGDQAKFAQAHAQYMQDWNDWQQAQLAPQRQQEQVTNKVREILLRDAEQLAEDASTLIKERKVKQELVVDAIQSVSEKFDSAFNSEGAFNHLSAGLVDGGGAKLAYFLHQPKNQAYLNKLLKMVDEDPTGIRATSYATQLVMKMKGGTVKKVSNAPEPDESVKGDGNVDSTRGSDLQAKYDKTTDFTELRKLRQQARELGIKLVNR